jgi:hypothetical protein
MCWLLAVIVGALIVQSWVLARAFRKASRSPDDRDRHAHR